MALIKGIAYPLQIDPIQGNLVVKEDEALIKDHIFSVLETRPLERVMRPAYGTPEYIFDTVQSMTAIARKVENKLRESIPQAEFRVTGKLGTEGEGTLTIYWAVNRIGQQPIEINL